MTCDVTDCSCALNPLFSLFQSTNRTMSSVNVHLDIFMGDEEQHKLAEAAYLSTCDLLANNAAIYGLPSDPQHLSQEQQVILREIDVIAFSSMLSPHVMFKDIHYLFAVRNPMYYDSCLQIRSMLVASSLS